MILKRKEDMVFLLLKTSYKVEMEDTLLLDVYKFCKEAQILRTPENCVDFYNGKYSVADCNEAMRYLFNTRKMGAYYFEADANPQKYMQKYILKHISSINKNSRILEVGPGNLPLFYENDYPYWYGIDYNNRDGIINFSGNIWGGFYSHLYTGNWDEISTVVDREIEIKKFDLVCGSHSFEHCFKPITALKEAGKVLVEGGHIVLFVPDGFSTWQGNYDRTHTLYLVPDMIKEFFNYAECFRLVKCEQFRTNMDLVVIAQKI